MWIHWFVICGRRNIFCYFYTTNCDTDEQPAGFLYNWSPWLWLCTNEVWQRRRSCVVHSYMVFCLCVNTQSKCNASLAEDGLCNVTHVWRRSKEAKSASAANRCSRRWIRRFKWLKASYRSHYCTTEPAAEPSALWSVGFSVNTRHINFANRWNKKSRKVGSGNLYWQAGWAAGQTPLSVQHAGIWWNKNWISSMHHVIFTDTTHSFVFAHFWTTGTSRVWVPAVFPLYTTPMGFISNYKYVTEVRLSALFHFKGLIKVLHEPFSN